MSEEAGRPSSAAKQAGQSASVSDTTKLATLLAEAVAERDTLKTVIDAMPDTGLTIRDRDYRLIFQSELTMRLYGNRLGEKCYSVFEGKDDVCEGCPVALAFEDGKPHTSVREVVMPSGDIAFWENVASPIRDADGNIVSCLEINTDITERKEAEERLRDSENRFRTLFENMAQGVFYQRNDGVLVDCNSAALRMFGLSRDEFMGKTSVDPRWKVIHEDGTDFAGEQHPSMEALRTGKPVLDVVAGVLNPCKKDYVWLSINAIPQFKQGEDKPYQVFVTLHDITQRKEAEEELRRYEHMVTSASDMTALLAKDFTYLTANPAYLAAFGKARDEVVGHTVREVFGEDFFESELRPSAESCMGGEEVRHYSWFDFPTLGKRYIATAFSPYIGSDDEVCGFALVARDVTERKEAVERHRLLTQHAGVAIGYFSLDGVVLEFNEMAAANMGGTAEDFIGKTLVEMFGEEAGSEYIRRIDAAAKSGTPMEYEDTVPLPSGNKTFISTYASIRSDDAVVLGVQVVSHDITEREQSREALQESERRFRAVFDWSFQFALILDLEGTVLEMNALCSKVTGQYARGVVGSPLWEAGWWKEFPDVREKTKVAIRRSSKGEVVQDEVTFIDAEHRIHHGSRTFSPIRNDADGVVMIAVAGLDITERKEAEERLSRFSELVDVSPASITIHDAKGDFLYANQKTFDLHGYTRAEFMALNLHDLDVPESEGLIEDRMREIRDRGEASFDVRHFRKDGSTVPLNVTVWLSHWGNEMVFESIAVDISERKKAQDALNASRDLLRSVVDNAPIRVFWKDTALRYLGCNVAFASDAGMSRPEDLIGKDDFLMSWREQAEMYRADDKLVMDSNTPKIGFEEQQTTPDGRIIWLRTSKVPLHDAEGRVIGLLGIYDDITERKEAEAALRESEDFLNRTGDTALVGGWHIDLDRQKVVWTRTTGKIHELPEGYFPDLEEAFHYYHPDDQGHVRQCVERAIGEGEPFDFTTRLITAKGNERWVRALGQPEFESGKCVRLSGTFQDITEQRQLEERLRQTEKMDAIGQLAGGVAHDFNNQLGGIMNYADLLLSKTEDEELRRCADAIIRSCTRGKDLTGQLLAFSRKGKYQTVPVNIHHTIVEVVSILEHSIDKRIAIRQHLDANPATTSGDPTQLQNALLNLGLNARDAMPEGGELVFTTGTVMLDEKHCRESRFDIVPGDYLKVTVADSGTGMDEATRAKVFEPFFTTKEEGKGTGMGLASVYGTVVNHHGAIEVDSEVGRGTTMTVFLPLSKQEAQERATPAGTVAAKSSGTRVLLVDDEKSVRIGTAELLRGRGYKVVTAENGVEAVEYYGKSWEHIDIVVVDMNMPLMNGRDTFIAMRKTNPEVKAILATGYSLDDNAQEILDEGALSHIQKPYRVDDLVQQIEQALSV